MRNLTQGWLRQHVSLLSRQFLEEGNLPFTDVLSATTIAPAWDAFEAPWKDRIYSPLVTPWVFLSQVISADYSCRAAVARLIVHRLSRGLEACSPDTGAYCRARERLPETFVVLQPDVPEQLAIRWLGHRESEMVRHYYHVHDQEALRQTQRLEVEFPQKGAGESPAQ